VLSSAAVLSYKTSLWQGIMNFFACMAFLYHIRVADESRDFSHDSVFHPERPVQRGLITVKELFIFDIPGLAFFLFTSVLFGLPSILYGSALLLFSFIAWKDFFLGEKLKKRFFLYNAVNMFQMVLLQFFIYAVFTCNFKISGVMWIHLLFVIFNTIIMEFVRKIKTSVDETKGRDTYSWHLGYHRSLRVFYLFSVTNYLTFVWMLYTISRSATLFVLIALILLILLTVAVMLHFRLKRKATEQFLLLSTVVNYVGLNLLIYIFNL
jgi:4-hydroxybenzoate polyprenyltransferase